LRLIKLLCNIKRLQNRNSSGRRALRGYPGRYTGGKVLLTGEEVVSGRARHYDASGGITLLQQRDTRVFFVWRDG